MPTRAVALDVGFPDVLGRELPETLAIKASGGGFWELRYRNKISNQ